MASIEGDTYLSGLKSKAEKDKDTEVVDKPPHYLKYKIEPITFVMTNQLPFAEGNVIKYIMRWRDKNGIQDLKKAKRYIDLIIELEETGNIDPKKEWKE
jgi:hypothetical protein